MDIYIYTGIQPATYIYTYEKLYQSNRRVLKNFTLKINISCKIFYYIMKNKKVTMKVQKNQ